MMSKIRFVLMLVVSLVMFIFIPINVVSAATAPSLGVAASFSVLGSSAVTNTGTTTVSGDLGVSPGTSITNGGVLTISGATHNNDVTSIQAHTDAGTADGTMLSQGSTGSVGPALDGLNLVPGVYDIGAGRLNGGVLILNGQGVYIFRASSDFVSSGSISFTNGARACDLYWDVQTQATINGTSFAGTIVAGSGVVFGSGVSLDGRALVFGGTGPVTMIGDTISGPSCASIASPTPAPAASSNSSSNSSSSTTDVCVADAITTVPIILELKRVSPTSIFLSWGPYAGLDTFTIQYGPTNGNWLYNTTVTGFSTTINELPANQTFWFQVAAKNNCATGTYGEARPVGQSTSVNSNVLGASIGLPNTGMGPKKDIPWNLVLPGSALVVLLTSYLIQRKSKSLSKQ